ncbi:ABC transporter permease [uncultured Marivita sp.]|uniref:ABC transporter permease n=1 Tax=uncultured Marivita sp. TaxID=888080 RepID=UPI002601BB72|nr:ABC transporter permease [uncultured Marivita sp.]
MKSTLMRLGAVWGLGLLLIVLLITFSVLLPDTFPTAFTFSSLASSRSIYAMAALAVMIPLIANQFDLSVAGVIGLSQILAIGLQTQSGISWPTTCAIVLAIGMCVGAVNAWLVAYVRIHSFVATLGVGSVLIGLLQWYTQGRQVVGDLPEAYIALASRLPGTLIPMPMIYALVLALILWIIFEYSPFGRHLYVIGDNPRAAQLNGIPEQRYTAYAFIAAGFVAALTGIILQAQLRIGQSTVGQEFLLPAFSAALLGATTIKPGRVNVWGTMIAVAVLAVTVGGLNQLGAPFFVEPLFNGLMLTIAVGLSVTAARRREAAVTEK